MSLATKQNYDTLTIIITGRFDFSGHSDFRAAMDKISPDIKKVEIDLVNTDYIDSSALGMLLVLRDKVANKAEIKIINARNEVKKILEIANFNKLFTMS